MRQASDPSWMYYAFARLWEPRDPEKEMYRWRSQHRKAKQIYAVLTLVLERSSAEISSAGGGTTDTGHALSAGSSGAVVLKEL